MRIALRELFLLVALVAMGCGWWARERQLVREKKELSDEHRSQSEVLQGRELMICSLLEDARDGEHFHQKRREVLQELTIALKARGILWYRADDGKIRLSEEDSAISMP